MHSSRNVVCFYKTPENSTSSSSSATLAALILLSNKQLEVVLLHNPYILNFVLGRWDPGMYRQSRQDKTRRRGCTLEHSETTFNSLVA